MKIAVFSLKKNAPYKKEIERKVLQSGFALKQKNPEIVISVGGDGTFLFAERKYPSVPKILVKRSTRCHKCQNIPLDKMLLYLKKRKYSIEKLPKIVAQCGKKKFYAINDIIIRNKDQQRALRFAVSINNERMDGELIGDGLVVATPYGSTAYFHSISRKTFSKGLGMAFNNTTKTTSPHLLKGKEKIEVIIRREKAVLSADNNLTTSILLPGQKVSIKKSPHYASLIRFPVR